MAGLTANVFGIVEVINGIALAFMHPWDEDDEVFKDQMIKDGWYLGKFLRLVFGFHSPHK